MQINITSTRQECGNGQEMRTDTSHDGVLFAFLNLGFLSQWCIQPRCSP
jgi:hypothetical protein